MASEEPILRDEEVDDLILGWLQKRNLSKSLEVLKVELECRRKEKLKEDVVENIWKSDSKLAENGLLVSIAAKGDAGEYAKQYKLFAEWVTSALDDIRMELSQLLYPVFVHTFVTMVQLESSTAAQNLLTGMKDLFLAQILGPSRREALMEELHELTKLTSPDQCMSSPVLKPLMEKRIVVSMSEYASEVLSYFLRQNKLILIAGILNRSFMIDISAGRGQLELEFNLNVLATASTGGDFGTKQIGQLDLELLKDSRILKYEELRLQGIVEELEDKDEETMQKTEKLEHQAALDAARTKLGKVANRGIKSSYPLPPEVEVTEDEIKADVETNKKTDMKMPMCAFVTFVNSSSSLTTMTTNSKMDTVISGFSDASIRLQEIVMQREGWNKSGTRTKELIGHSGPVYSVDLSADDSLLLSSSGDGSIRLWSTELMANMVAFTGHMLPVWDARFACNRGYYFASAGADRTARLWSTERTVPLRIFTGHMSDVEVVQWHPNCQLLATGSSDNSVRIWDVASGACVRVLEGHRAPITALAFSPQGDTMSSADADGDILCWDLGTAKPFGHVGVHRGPVWSMTYSYYDGLKLATGGQDCRVNLWDLTNFTKLEDGQIEESFHFAPLLASWETKATPVTYLHYSPRNLLLGGGPMTLTR